MMMMMTMMKMVMGDDAMVIQDDGYETEPLAHVWQNIQLPMYDGWTTSHARLKHKKTNVRVSISVSKLNSNATSAVWVP